MAKTTAKKTVKAETAKAEETKIEVAETFTVTMKRTVITDHGTYERGKAYSVSKAVKTLFDRIKAC